MGRRTAEKCAGFTVWPAALAAPNLVLGTCLAVWSGSAMLRADGTGEGLLMMAVALAGVVLAFCAAPGMWWAATITERQHDANRTRLAITAIIAAVTWSPAGRC